MFNVTNLNRFLLVAFPCLQRILLQFTIQPLFTYYILYPEQKTFTNYYTLPFTLKAASSMGGLQPR